MSDLHTYVRRALEKRFGARGYAPAWLRGKCPACGRAELFVGRGGHATCSAAECPDPTAVDRLLHGEAKP